MQHLSAPGCNAAPMLAEPSDGELLSRFAATGDEAAFEALLQRYAPMVRGVCWHVLHHQQDGEDAFQQIFVVLARKAASISKEESFPSWLYSVAYRTARDVRKGKRRHDNREQPRDPTQITQITQISDGLESQESLLIICREVQRLPEKYRFPLVLHCLEGKSEAETAAELGLTKGKVAQRVRRAREILRRNLARRGIELPGQPVLTRGENGNHG